MRLAQPSASPRLAAVLTNAVRTKSVLTKGLVRVLGAMPRRPPADVRHHWRGLGLLRRRKPAASAAATDPVAMVAMAIDRLGPAAVRASCSGVSVRVAVPDDTTAAIFRAALAMTQTRRSTDRLIEITVEPPASRA